MVRFRPFKLFNMHPLHLVALFSFTAAASPLVKRADPPGIDVSHFQGTIDWSTVVANGVAFTYIKATEGTSTLALFFLHDISSPTGRRHSVHRSYVQHELYWRDECRSHPGSLSLCPPRYLGRRHAGQFLPRTWWLVHVTATG